MTAPTSTSGWSPNSWKAFPIEQAVVYEGEARVEAAEAAFRTLSSLPPLVHAAEVAHLKDKIALAQQGKAFILQGGDCAERFVDCTEEDIALKAKILLEMSAILGDCGSLPVITIGRMAGQYAKPRSKLYEVVDGVTFPVFRGEVVNGISTSDREADPTRLLLAYYHSAATLNCLRALRMEDLERAGRSTATAESQGEDSAHEEEKESGEVKVDCQGVHGRDHHLHGHGTGLASEHHQLFTSHEGLLLPYEAALTRHSAVNGWTNLSAHFLWIGDRTRQLTGAHVEYFRGISNPIGIKCGVSLSPSELVALITLLNPSNEAGRITVITRLGVANVTDALPPLLQAVSKAGLVVAWLCDPCHGNTTTTADGYKTRDFDDILHEILQTAAVCRGHGVPFAGVHVELTGHHVTECTGGCTALEHGDLSDNYQTYCDPRLNYSQSIELATKVGDMLWKKAEAGSSQGTTNITAGGTCIPPLDLRESSGLLT